jgi:hypothetical protein
VSPAYFNGHNLAIFHAFIDILDIDESGFQRSTPNSTGRSSYNPLPFLLAASLEFQLAGQV